jgi:hypothetical protein
MTFSCGIRNQGEKESNDTLQTVTRTEPLNKSNSFGTITVESTIQGKDDKDFWEKGLKVIEYKVSRNDSVLTTIKISPSEFSDLYNQSNVIVTVDFKGKKSYRDSPPECSSGTKFSFNKIVDCNGVYDFEKPVLEYTNCCTIFSDLVNNSTLLYVLDWSSNQDEKDTTKRNAFLIDIYSKDTLDSFLYRDFTEALGYSALIDTNRKMGILALLQSKTKELITWDTLLTKKVYDLSKLKSVPDLSPTGDFIELYNEEMERVIIEFDANKKPIRWNK